MNSNLNNLAHAANWKLANADTCRACMGTGQRGNGEDCGCKQFDLISKVGYRETLIATFATKQAAQSSLAQYQAMEKDMPGCYPNLFIRQARHGGTCPHELPRFSQNETIWQLVDRATRFSGPFNIVHN